MKTRRSGLVLSSSLLFLSCATPSQTPEEFRGVIIQGTKGKPALTRRAKLTAPLDKLPGNVKRGGLSFDPNSVYIFQADPIYKTYTVQGRTIESVAASMDSAFGKPDFVREGARSGYQSRIRYSYDISCEGGASCRADNVASCRFQNIQVWTEISIALPELADKSRLCPYAGGVWPRFETSVKEHEKGHVTNLEQITIELGKGLAGLNTDRKYRSCGQMTSAIQDLYAIQELRLKEKDLEYDIRTQRGELSGACFGRHCEGYDKTQDTSCR